MPGEGEKSLRIDEKAIFALQQVGLLNTTIALDPIQQKKQETEESDRKYIYRRWRDYCSLSLKHL